MRKNKLENLTNEELIERFDWCCTEWTKTINFNPKREEKCAKLHAETRAELMRRLNERG